MNGPATGPAVGVVLRRARDYLARHGVAEPDASAERLLLHVLGMDRADLGRGDRHLTPTEAKAFGRALCRRCAGEPVQHVTGETGFRRLRLAVRPGVFVPRPETEVVVERALALLAGVPSPRVADVGTGTGAIALAIKDERPDALVTAIDRAPAAVSLARENAVSLGLDVEVVAGDLLGGLEPDRTFEAIVSNPPYVPAGAYEDLPPEVRADPIEAVVGGPGDYRALVAQAKVRLEPGGVLALEIEASSAATVVAIVGSAGFTDVVVAPDLAGRDRVVTARWPG